MFLVCRVDPRDDYGLIHEIMGSFDNEKDAETTADYLNFKSIHDQLKTNDIEMVQHLISVVENTEKLTEPFDQYIVTKVQMISPYTEPDINELRSKIISLKPTSTA